jgi:hypothetical protein
MPSMRAVFSGAMLLGALTLQTAAAQNPPSSPDVPTLHVTSRLVFLDVTVLDSKGHPVTKGLTKDDFTITQDKKPQRIFSFEPPDEHIAGNASDDNPSGKAPVTIFVLDQLNSTFEQMAYIRYCVHKYLAHEPAELKAPAEVMVLGNTSLEMVQGYTRNKKDLLSAVDHIPPALPYKLNGAFFSERFLQSINGLRQIALENTGIPGRKNIIWVGHGGPSLYTDDLDQIIRTSVDLGSHYYTLTYQPPESIANGKFLRVRVTMRNPNLHVLTKAGYFSPDKGQPTDPRVDALYNIAEALQTNVPFTGLGVTINKIIRHHDTNSAEFTVDVSMKNLTFKTEADGRSGIDIGFAGGSLSDRRFVLSSKTEAFTLTNPSQDEHHLQGLHTNLTMTLRIPRKTHSVRIVVGTLVGGRIGTVDIDRRMIDTAPDLPTPEPKLIPQPAKRPPQ